VLTNGRRHNLNFTGKNDMDWKDKKWRTTHARAVRKQFGETTGRVSLSAGANARFRRDGACNLPRRRSSWNVIHVRPSPNV